MVIYLVIIKVKFNCTYRHGWLHSIVDEPPTNFEYKNSIAYTGHCENETGTPNRYTPYNTTISPKIKEYNFNENDKELLFMSLADRLKEKFISKT